MDKQHFYNTIKDFLNSGGRGGRFTECIAKEYGITNRQAGGMMSVLSKKGLLQTYRKGYIVFTQRDGRAAPCGITNTYYEWVGD